MLSWPFYGVTPIAVLDGRQRPKKPLVPDKSPAIIALDRDDLTLDCATKACAGDGVKTLRRWLDDGKADVLILHNGRREPLVLLSWGTWNRVARTIAPQLQDLSE